MTENPFLLPPGSGPRPRDGAPEAPVVPPPARTPERSPDGYIAVPASVESATHRIERVPEVRGAPEVPEVPEETRVARPSDALPAADPAPRAWSLVLPDGTRLAMDGAVLLGRDPAVLADRPDARPVALTDSGKTVSKTHALLETIDGGIRVRELHSTNGVAITTGGVRTVIAPGGEGSAVVGSVIELGSFTVLVDAR